TQPVWQSTCGGVALAGVEDAAVSSPLLIAGDFQAAWEVARVLRPRRADAALSAELRVPTPYPAAWAAWALGDFDRAFRWALRAAESGTSVADLVASGARPAKSHRGIALVEVEPGSWQSHLDPTDALDKVFESKHWRVFTGLLIAFGAVDW